MAVGSTGVGGSLVAVGRAMSPLVRVGGTGVAIGSDVGGSSGFVAVGGSGVFVATSSTTSVGVRVAVARGAVAVAGRLVGVLLGGADAGVGVLGSGVGVAGPAVDETVGVAVSSVGVIVGGSIVGGGVLVGVAVAMGTTAASSTSVVGRPVGVIVGVAVGAFAASRAVATTAFAARTYIVVARRKTMTPMTNSAAAKLLSASYQPHA
jgi:hypothetical protein